MESPLSTQFIRFLEEELAIPTPSIMLALQHHPDQTPHLLPIVLWQYGLVTLSQLDQMLDWLENAPMNL